MKKTLLFVFAVATSLMIFGQQTVKFRDGLKDCRVPNRVFSVEPSTAPLPTPIEPIQSGGEKAIVLRMIGTSGNAFGFLGVRQYLWADAAINSISFVHRMNVPPNGPGSGYLAYDYSINGGETWTNDVQVYEAPTATLNARYPQGAFYNPAGNTEPTNAYFSYFAAVLDGSNGGTWGGYGYGSHQFGTTELPTQHNVAATPDWLQGVPEAFTITSQGLAICVDPTNNGVGQPYQDYMILTKGHFNPEIGDFEMDRYLEFMPAGGVSPVSGSAAGVADCKVAFSPDGQIGYIAYLSNNGENTIESEGCYHPILYKTIDGGETWEGPYNVQLGGVDGLPAILNYLTDELIEIMFEPPLPAREDIPFTSAFELGISVDFSGNPHLLFDVGVGSQDWSIYTSYTGSTGCDGLVGMFHVWSPNGGEDWLANQVALMENFRGEFPYSGGDPVAEDNRPFIASTPDGTKLFFNWVDTNIEDYEANDQPDIYCVGYNVVNNTYSDTYIVTQFSAAWYSSFMAAGSKFVLDLGNGSYKVPFVYQQLNPLNVADPVQFWFVDNFILTDGDLGLIQDVEEMNTYNFSVSQNYPNPSDDFTYIDINTGTDAEAIVTISNLLGQNVRDISPIDLHAGKHQIRLNTKGLPSGIYTYNVQIDDKMISKKMIVK
ncbi:MAG: T9SS type A sorting domain-containing protein [Sphingobacteriia bacterium]|nr:T9SS type A sorting domain-containing protein [Sphingobacteriia bacterium]